MFDVVRQAWTEALPTATFDPDTSWEAAGADSLRSLHLVMNLERALGRKVPFDLISRQMTARDLAGLLAQPADRVQPTAGPTVFLVPGVFGDGPILADFRRSFGGDVRFVVVELPDMDVPVAVHADLSATGRHVAEAIMAQAPDGSINLAGFSYGGVVAFETAHHLIAHGREVAFLGLLDSFGVGGGSVPAPLDAAERQAPAAADGDDQAGADDQAGLLAKLKPRRGEGLRTYAERVAFGLSLKFNRIDLARRITLAGRSRLSQDQIIGRRKIVLGMGRMRAVDGWTPTPLDVPTLLACTDDGARLDSPTIWAARCPRLQVLRIAGGHFDLFLPPALAILTPAFRQAVIAADTAASNSRPG